MTTPETTAERIPVQSEGQIPWRGVISLFIVYFFWGSTYLAIRIAVREGSGFPPMTMSATRFLVAGLALLLWSTAARRRVKLSRQELFLVAASGLLLFLGGNGMLTWAEQRAESGYAALLIGASPIWVAVMESILDRRLPTPFFLMALLTGFAGIAVLSLPVLRNGGAADLASLSALLLAAVCWSAGSLIISRRKIGVTSRVSAAYQNLFGALGLGLAAVAIGEPAPAPVPEAIGAWAYLIVFGSLIGFTAYIYTLRTLPTSVAMTYAYVNPVIAVILGWLILKEPVTGWTIAGAALVLFGVAGVFRERRVRRAARVQAAR